MQTKSPCVLHVADGADGEALETLCRTTQVLSNVGVDQVLLILAQDAGTNLLWSAALAAEVRPLDCAGISVFAKIRALQSEFARAAKERSLHAVHLHGVAPCLLGSHALKGNALPRRVLYSPHLAHFASEWASTLFGRLLQSHVQLLDCAAVTASLTEAQMLSRLLNRSAEILPHPVSRVFFQARRRESRPPRLLADGTGEEAAPVLTRLCVLLNGREARVPVAWLGAAEGRMRDQLDAASVEVLAIQDEAARAEALAGAIAFLHVSRGNRLPLAVAQAMAAGVPSLVSETPSHRALVRHGETGFVCTSDRDFLEKLILLLRDPEETRRIGEAARADAERWFTLRRFERAVLRAYGFSTTGAFQAADAAERSIELS